VLDAAAALDPSAKFVFATGDVVAWGGSYSFWKTMYEQDFFTRYMFADCLGNHDAMPRTGPAHRNDWFRVVHNFPTNGYPGQEGVCYWFIYGNSLFFTFNNEAMYGNFAEQAAAKKWAGAVIEQQKGRYQYIFIAEHYQWFDGRQGRTNWYSNWKDFCDEHHVTVAMAGNNHVYLRTRPLFHDQVVPGAQGTVYMQAPSSDGDRGVETGTQTENLDKIACTYSSHVQSGNGYNEVKTIGCVLMKVTPKSLTSKLVYIDETGAVHVADECTVKLDEK